MSAVLMRSSIRPAAAARGERLRSCNLGAIWGRGCFVHRDCGPRPTIGCVLPSAVHQLSDAFGRGCAPARCAVAGVSRAGRCRLCATVSCTPIDAHSTESTPSPNGVAQIGAAYPERSAGPRSTSAALRWAMWCGYKKAPAARDCGRLQYRPRPQIAEMTPSPN